MRTSSRRDEPQPLGAERTGTSYCPTAFCMLPSCLAVPAPRIRLVVFRGASYGRDYTNPAYRTRIRTVCASTKCRRPHLHRHATTRLGVREWQTAYDARAHLTARTLKGPARRRFPPTGAIVSAHGPRAPHRLRLPREEEWRARARPLAAVGEPAVRACVRPRRAAGAGLEGQAEAEVPEDHQGGRGPGQEGRRATVWAAAAAAHSAPRERPSRTHHS